MQVTFEFAATTRDAVEERRIERAAPPGAAVEDAVRVVCEEFSGSGLVVFDGSGRLRPSVDVLVDGDSVRAELDDELDIDAEAGGETTVTVLPAVSGGMGRTGRTGETGGTDGTVAPAAADAALAGAETTLTTGGAA